MAAVLAATPVSGVTVELCGDHDAFVAAARSGRPATDPAT
jgi:hypothetical protein